MGVAWVRLKRNPSLSRSALDPDLVPDKVELVLKRGKPIFVRFARLLDNY
jgi:hypothetical protein